jgi:seryl-tRNA synthetase
MNDIAPSVALTRPESLAPEAVYGNGLTALTGNKLKLFQKLESLYLSWAAECGAVEYQFPVMIPARELNKIGYFKSFPHHLTFPVSLDSDHKNLADFVARDVLSAEGEVSLEGCQCAPVSDVLTPAACYHFYANFQGSELDRPLYLTTRATCFRKEVKYTPLRRQWSFSMRELVCIGTAAEVGAFLDERRARVEQLFQSIGLPISWDGATDPFFNPSSNPKYLAQKLDPVKTEMVFGGDLAIGSVNFHRNYFGEAFKISRHGEDAYSGCVAFGVERWISAFTAHFGEDPAAWPNLDIRS